MNEKSAIFRYFFKIDDELRGMLSIRERFCCEECNNVIGDHFDRFVRKVVFLLKTPGHNRNGNRGVVESKKDRENGRRGKE